MSPACAQRLLSRRAKLTRMKKANGNAAPSKSNRPLNPVQRMQLNRARVLLETSRYSVESIAEQVGYKDATALRRLMRRLLNVSPKQQRR